MENRPESAAIRNRIWASPALCLAAAGCILGGGLAFGGFQLADKQDAALKTQTASYSAHQDTLKSALREARLTGPRLRLEELATLPLVPEYLAISAEQPDSLDAEELNAYLQTVLDAALQETGLARITLETSDGHTLIDALNQTTKSSGTSGTKLQAVVLSLDGNPDPEGQLTGYLAANDMKLLAAPNTELTETTASIGNRSHDQAIGSLELSIPQATRLLALFGGIGTALMGLFGAFLLRRQ
jgi:hypothetical protein